MRTIFSGSFYCYRQNKFRRSLSLSLFLFNCLFLSLFLVVTGAAGSREVFIIFLSPSRSLDLPFCNPRLSLTLSFSLSHTHTHTLSISISPSIPFSIFIYLSIYLPIYLSIKMSIYIYLFVCQSICLSTSAFLHTYPIVYIYFLSISASSAFSKSNVDCHLS